MNESLLGTEKLDERYMPIVSQTGEMTEVFKAFYNMVSAAILAKDWDMLFQWTDRTLSLEEFKSRLNYCWSDRLDVFGNIDKHLKGIDIVPDHIKDYSNVLGKLNINLYYITNSLSIKNNKADVGMFKNNKNTPENKTLLKKVTTPIYFAYIDEKFIILSHLDTFTEMEE